MTTQDTQTEMFPADEADRAQAVLNFLLERRKKAVKALDTAENNLEEVDEKIAQQEHVLKLLRDHSVTQTRVEADEEIEDAEIVGEEPAPLPALDGVAEKDGIAYDTATGEVVKDESDWQPYAEERVVYVVGPDDEIRKSEVGERTHWAELIADYLSETGEDAELDDFEIVATPAGEDSEHVVVNVHAEIPPIWWGRRVRVRVKDETSSEVEESANGEDAADEPWEYEGPEGQRDPEAAEVA